MDISSYIVVNKIAELFFLVITMGVIAYYLWIIPSHKALETRTIVIGLRVNLWVILAVCLMFLLLTSILGLGLRTASMAEVSLTEAIPLLTTTLFKTLYGQLWLYRISALLILIVLWVVHWLRFDTQKPVFASLGLLVVVVFTLSASGHAGDDGVFAFLNILNSIHILGALLWGGIILVGVFIILPKLIESSEVRVPDIIAQVSIRMSTVAGVALALVIVPGVYNAWILLGSIEGIWQSLFGQLLFFKVLLVGVMAGLGALNRYAYVPSIQREMGQDIPSVLIPIPESIARRGRINPLAYFRRSLWQEAALLLAVLILAAILSQQTPAAHEPESNGMSQHTAQSIHG